MDFDGRKDEHDALVHLPTGYFFHYKGTHYYGVDFAPGRHEFKTHISFASPEIMQGYAREWIGHLKRELGQPDLWATLQAQSDFGSPDEAELQKPFTPEEQVQVSIQLKEIREYLLNVGSVNETQLRTIDKRLAYLESASKRQTKFDWRGSLLSFVLELALGAIISSENVANFFGTVKVLFSGLLKFNNTSWLR